MERRWRRCHRQRIESIKDDANRLLDTTTELLNITQVETGKIQLSIIPTEPKAILEYAINANKTLAEQKQIQLKTDYPKDLFQWWLPIVKKQLGFWLI